MSDSLKEHIDNTREDFEIYPFESDKSWEQISKKVMPEKKWPLWKLTSVAACFLLVLSGAIYQLVPQNPQGELADLESYYQGEISQKVNLIKSHLKDPSVLEDLDLMDQAFAELKNDLKDDVDNEEVVLAMMENYQLKLKILEEILLELENENNASTL